MSDLDYIPKRTKLGTGTEARTELRVLSYRWRIVRNDGALLGSAPTEAAARQTADVLAAYRGHVVVESRGRAS